MQSSSDKKKSSSPQLLCYPPFIVSEMKDAHACVCLFREVKLGDA